MTTTAYTRPAVSRDVYADVTDKIIAALEEGTVPWRQPWKNFGGQRNLNSGRPYRGINVFLLLLESLERGYSDPRWATYNGVKKAGGQVRRGEKGTRVILWKPVRGKDNEDPEKERSYLILREYTVFNAEQCDGLPEYIEGELDFCPNDVADGVIEHYTSGSGPKLGHGGDSAYYFPPTDSVTVPVREAFASTEDYYGVVFHELIHSTGHESRLKRLEKTGFGSGPYAKEELVAEIGATFLCGTTGVERKVELSAAYIKGWLHALKDDKKLIISAAAHAQKAADLVAGITFEEKTEDES